MTQSCENKHQKALDSSLFRASRKVIRKATVQANYFVANAHHKLSNDFGLGYEIHFYINTHFPA